MITIPRREFLKCSAAAIGALPLVPGIASRAAGEDAADKLPIVDTHQHLWDLERFRLPWVDSQPALKRSYLPADYAKAAEGLNVVKAVYMEVDVDPTQQVAEAEYLIELCESRKTPTVAAVISGRPGEESFRPYITRFKDSPYIKGVRQVLHVPSAPRGLCLEKTYVAGVRLLGELGKSFDLCMRPTELADAAKLAEMCADTRLIIDHCGNADPKAFMNAPPDEPAHEVDPWKRDMAALAKRDNVLCKISGIVARAPKGTWRAEHLAPIVNFCLDTFGPDRVVFGSDWPVCTLAAEYAQWVAALKEIIAERDALAQRKLLHDNAVRYYGLS
jgi:predicted TIM-barrel fold metal-dependent hydrolase